MSDEHGAPRPDEHSVPRPDAAAPAWYPHPRRPGALRYWNGVAWVDTDATEGWYPDPRDRTVLRFWTGQAWGEVLAEEAAAPEPEPVPPPVPQVAPAPAPGPAPIPAMAPNPRLEPGEGAPSRAWLTSIVAVACLVAGVVVGGVVVSTLQGDEGPSATRTVTATASPTATGGAAAGSTEGELQVRRVLSARTLLLRGPEGGVEVRLLGLGGTTCDTNGPGKDLLKESVEGQDAVVTTLTDPTSGEVGAYVDVDGRDVGELLVAAGLATAVEGHPRSSAYSRAEAGATPYCTASASPSSSPQP